MSKVQITPALILGMLEAGKNRKVIQEELGLTKKDVDLIFQHPELKNKKVKKVYEPGFVWAEESTEETAEINENTEIAEDHHIELFMGAELLKKDNQ